MSRDACAETVRRGDPDRFLACMAAPVAMRPKLFAIYAFNVEVARAPWVTSEPLIAQMRLQWWHDVLEEIATGGNVRQHEITDQLTVALDKESAAILMQLVKARHWDIDHQPFDDGAHFQTYLDATAGGLMWAAARAVGVRDGEGAIRTVGAAAGLASWLRAVPELTARGRVPLVNNDPQAIAELAKAALAKLINARAVVPIDARAVTRAGWLADRTLRSAAADPAAVANGRLHTSELSKRLRLLGRVLAGAA